MTVRTGTWRRTLREPRFNISLILSAYRIHTLFERLRGLLPPESYKYHHRFNIFRILTKRAIQDFTNNAVLMYAGCCGSRRPVVAAIDRYLLPAGPTAANHRSGMQRLIDETDRLTDTVSLHRPYRILCQH